MNNAEYSLELRSLGKVFDFEYDFYDEMFRCNFEQKFIDHYYFYEIGFETIERFKHNLKAHLNLKMPYYDQLYKTELAAEGLDFLLNKDLKETFIRTVDTEDKLVGSNNVFGTKNGEEHSSGSSNTEGRSYTQNDTTNSSRTDTSSETTNDEKRSDVADGVASASLSTQYLTSVGRVDNATTGATDVKESGTNNTGVTSSDEVTNNIDVNNSETARTEGSNTEDKTGKLLEKTELISQGNIGVTSSAELLEKWRKVIINIDEMIIYSCRDMFMGVF